MKKGLVYVIGGILGGAFGLLIMGWLPWPADAHELYFLIGGAGGGVISAHGVAKFMR